MSKKIWMFSFVLALLACTEEDSNNTPETDTDQSTNTPDEIFDNIGSAGSSEQCAENSTSQINQLSNSMFEFEITGEKCIAFNDTVTITKKTVPLEFLDDLEGFLDITGDVKIYSGMQSTYVFDFTNNSLDTHCSLFFSNIDAISADGTELTTSDSSLLKGTNINTGTQFVKTCIQPGETLQYFGVFEDSIDATLVEKIEINTLFIGRSSTEFVESSRLNAVSASWDDQSITFEFHNNSNKDISFTDVYPEVAFFDAQGYFLGLKALTPEVGSDYVVFDSQFSLSSDIADLDSSVVVALTILNWSEQDPNIATTSANN